MNDVYLLTGGNIGERFSYLQKAIENIEALVEELKNAGVKILDEITPSEYGKFVHILDPEGNSIELFEPPA